MARNSSAAMLTLGVLLFGAGLAVGWFASLGDGTERIVTVETVGRRAGLACWSREDLQRYPFLNLD